MRSDIDWEPFWAGVVVLAGIASLVALLAWLESI